MITLARTCATHAKQHILEHAGHMCGSRTRSKQMKHRSRSCSTPEEEAPDGESGAAAEAAEAAAEADDEEGA